jgi:hypothetical protein
MSPAEAASGHPISMTSPTRESRTLRARSTLAASPDLRRTPAARSMQKVRKWLRSAVTASGSTGPFYPDGVPGGAEAGCCQFRTNTDRDPRGPSAYTTVQQVGARVRRREFIALLGVTATCPQALRAQQPAIPVIGSHRSPVEGPRCRASWYHAFHERFLDHGWVPVMGVKRAECPGRRGIDL